MRIAYVCTDPGIPVFGAKGASIHVQEMLRAFLRRGASIVLISPRLGDPAPHDLAPVICRALPAPPPGGAEERADWALATNARVAEVLASLGPVDLVYERHALFAHAAMEWARARDVPSVLELNAPLIEEQLCHRTLVQGQDAVASARRVFAAAGFVAAVSAGAAAYAVGHGAEPDRVAVVPNGVDPARFPLCPPPTGPSTIGFLGSLKPWHDTTVLVDAVARLRGGPVPDVRLLIVGDGPERPRIAARIAAHGLEDATEFTGAVPAAEVPRHLARMHAGAAPYAGGPSFYFSPLKLYEYMAAGLPVVASSVGDLPEVLGGGRFGILVPPDDPDSLAAALARLATGPELRARLGQAGRDHVRAHRSWDAVASRILAAVGVAEAV